MRLLTAGSLVRVQQGEPHRNGRCSIQKPQPKAGVFYTTLPFLLFCKKALRTAIDFCGFKSRLLSFANEVCHRARAVNGISLP
ncbi:MAG: hypothetical protein DBX52_04215 [Clostridiales bacterium]|nr:MAG: hypothetical protein DBX52_04215 [Clostridiales bacterium]